MEMIYKALENMFNEFNVKINGKDIFNQIKNNYDLENIFNGNLICNVKIKNVDLLYFVELEIKQSKDYTDLNIISVSDGKKRITIQDIPIEGLF